MHQVMQGVRRSWLACTGLAADPPMSERELNAYATLGARAARAALVDLQLTGCGGGIGGSSSVNTANAGGGGGASGSVVGVQAERSLAAELRDTCVSGAEGAMGSMVVVQDIDGHGMAMSHRPLVDQSCRLMMSDLMRSRLTTSSSLHSFSSDSSEEILGECYPPLACPEEDSGNAVHEEVPFLLQLPLPSGAAGRSHRAPHTLPSAGRGEGGQAAREDESGGQLALALGREPRVLNSSLAGSSFAFVSSAGAGSSAAFFSTTTSSSYTTASNSNAGNFNSVSHSVWGGVGSNVTHSVGNFNSVSHSVWGGVGSNVSHSVGAEPMVGSKSAESSCSSAHQVKPTAVADNVDSIRLTHPP